MCIDLFYDRNSIYEEKKMNLFLYIFDVNSQEYGNALKIEALYRFFLGLFKKIITFSFRKFFNCILTRYVFEKV